jgi:hypothetical protein
MFEKFVTAVEPFGLTMVVIAGLVLAGRIDVADHVIVGYAAVFVGVGLIIVHVLKQMKTNKPAQKRKEQ